MKYYIISGEASGDLHGSNLMKSLFELDPNADIRFWGGDLMKAVGGTLVSHYKDRAFMGFVEVLGNLNKILGFIKFCKKDIQAYNPDVIIFIDNSGFNLRIARWAKKQGFYTNYYISPQVWASRSKRVEAIKKDVDRMFVILPFEKEYYQKFNVEVDFVGHPLIDAIANRQPMDEQEFRKTYDLNSKPIIALLPGSRKQEINKMLNVMLQMTKRFSDYQFVIAGAPSQEYSFYQTFIANNEVKFVDNKTYDLLSISHAALVTSGTATLETALFKVPQVVCYKASAITYQIAKRIVTLKFISLVNLIMDKEVVKELIQDEFNPKNLETELNKILDANHRSQLLENYEILVDKLGGKGASKAAAEKIIGYLNAKS